MLIAVYCLFPSYPLTLKSTRDMIEKVNISQVMNRFKIADKVSYVYAELADGSQVKINRADLKSQIAKTISFELQLNKGEFYDISFSYILIHITEVTISGNRGLFSLGYGSLEKWAGSNMWTTSDIDGHFCFFSLGEGAFRVKNNYADGCRFRMFLL